MRRRGDKKAIVAVAHQILVAAWQMLADDVAYRDPGGEVLRERSAQQARARAVRQLEALGHTVTLDAPRPAA
jgi:hypothetical protein